MEVYKDSFVDKDEFDFENIISSNKMNLYSKCIPYSKDLLGIKIDKSRDKLS